ncbi:NAD(P)-dependent oxidoreductase [Saccharicrinis aurantiacus]|uniref:NAD(P)-dependent oxidoreductase n=1 Tax=Saccharicrinis aurantiacus TaxID=1849719 RepID=UPI00249152CB|nr:NAD(P)-dependent oxidoreductase [Saccharicrinis aurantiacus]
MAHKILVLFSIPNCGFTELGSDYEVIFPKGEIISNEEIEQHIGSTDVIVSVFGNKLENHIIDKAPHLKLIANYGVGYDNVDINYAKEKGIVVTNTPDPVTEPTAELAHALMLAVARQVGLLNSKVRTNEGVTMGVMKNLSTTLTGKTLGIIGLGAIGKATARRAIASGMHVVYNKRTPLNSAEEQELKVSYMDLEDLLQQSDVVSLHTPLNNDTNGMIGDAEFQLMKNTAYIVNTARGPVIDENALINALQNNLIAGAGLDVYWNEPEIPQALLKFDNTVLTPHVGTATLDTREEMSILVSEIIKMFFNKNLKQYIVNG